MRKIFSINFRPTLNVGRTFFVFKVRSFKQKAVSRTPSIHVRGELKPLMLAGPFLFSKSGVLNKKRSLAPLPITSGVRLNYLKRHLLVRDFLRKFEFRKFGNFCFSEFSNQFPKIWKFLFSRNFGDNSKNEKAGIHALYRARYPPFPYDRRRSEGSTARRRRTTTKPPRGGGPAPQRKNETAARRRPGASRQRERERENSNSEKAGIRAIGHLFPPFL